ncbi:MAG TPA: class I SAM-dependent methyltransferase [Methylomirabilota bacterium]|nr:class I SAM-dependent methyltransferase [Methylomirabilota bacterium]
MMRQLARRARNMCRVARLRASNGLQVHLGCGNDHLQGFVNLDTRWTEAADIVANLSLPPLSPGSVDLAISHAFFEHLYRRARLPHLQRVAEALAPDGICCYIGLPYFPNVARFYLERAPGIVGPVFDLFNVYRYTHGDPEQAGAETWWLEQLHKSLFDESEVAGLLRGSGFGSFVLFVYVYPGDGAPLPVSMGFCASKKAKSESDLRRDCLQCVPLFGGKVVIETLQWLTSPAV